MLKASFNTGKSYATIEVATHNTNTAIAIPFSGNISAR